MLQQPHTVYVTVFPITSNATFPTSCVNIYLTPKIRYTPSRYEVYK
jgi:hypothetical protein